MTAPEELEQYLSQSYGSPSALIVRDPAHNTGLREWSDDDTRKLCQWLDDRSEAPRKPTRICHNLEQTAGVMGVGTHTVQAWLRREKDPLPHIRDGRRLLVPHFLLVRWVREEAQRNLEHREAGKD